MSMRDYAVDDYGLVLDEETIKVVASKVFDYWVEDRGRYDFAIDLFDKGICEYISEFTGEAQEVNDDGLYHWGRDIKDFNHDLIVYVPVSNYPTLFKKAYNNMDELVEEFKAKIGEYLPEDFDYRSNIRHICGTYYG